LTMALLAIGAWADTDTSHQPPIPELSHTVGVIEDIDLSGSTIGVNGQTFLITEETRICDEDVEGPLTLEDLILGTNFQMNQYVRVSLTPAKIKIAPETLVILP